MNYHIWIISFLLVFLNVPTRKFKIIHVALIIFLLNSANLRDWVTSMNKRAKIPALAEASWEEKLNIY
jgi:hypothetical protein